MVDDQKPVDKDDSLEDLFAPGTTSSITDEQIKEALERGRKEADQWRNTIYARKGYYRS